MFLFFLVPLEFLLPGYAWIRFSGLDKRFSIMETLVISFVLSVSFTSLFTAGLSLVTSHYLSYSVAASLGLSLILLIASIRLRKPVRSSLPKLNRAMFPVFATACVYAATLVTLFWSSPFYPTADAPDPITHAQVVEAISNGLARTTLIHSNYPIGMHFVAAILGALVGVDSLTAIRFLLSLVIVVTVFLTYFCARNVLGSDYANLAVIASAFIVPADAIHFIKVGTFPNVLSDALIIATLWLITSYTKEPNHSLGLTLTFLAVTGFFVHSTFLIFLAALWLALPVFYVAHRGRFGNYLMGLLFATVGLFVLLVLLGSFMSASFGRIFTGYVVSSFSSIPVYLYIQLLVYNYSFLAGPLGALSVFASVVFILAKRRSAIWPVLLCVWFAVPMVAAIISPEGWRFILLSMVPGGLLLGASIGSLRELTSVPARMNWAKARRILVPILICVLILSGGFVSLLPRVFDPSSRAREEAIVDSMSWLKQNDNGQGVASVGLSADYRYLTTLTGITYAGDFNESANSTVAEARGGNFAYVAVALQSPQFPTFQSSNMVQEKYRNSVVTIFFIAA
jgi:hypothetical protein